MQTRDNVRAFGSHTNLNCAVILGGVKQRSQVEVLRKGIDIIVATPGRLLDLVNQRIINLNSIEVLVLDEADKNIFIEPYLLTIWVFNKKSISTMSSSYKSEIDRNEAIIDYIEKHKENGEQADKEKNGKS